MNIATGMLAGLTLSASLAVAAQVAEAAAPKVKGKYAVIEHQICGGDLEFASNGKGSVHLEVGTSGFFRSGTGTLNFTGAAANSGQVSLSEQLIEGGPLTVNGLPKASNVTKRSKSRTGPYSNTATALTVGGQAYDASYGNIASGIARTVNLIRIEGTRCTQTLILTHE